MPTRGEPRCFAAAWLWPPLPPPRPARPRWWPTPFCELTECRTRPDQRVRPWRLRLPPGWGVPCGRARLDRPGPGTVVAAFTKIRAWLVPRDGLHIDRALGRGHVGMLVRRHRRPHPGHARKPA